MVGFEPLGCVSSLKGYSTECLISEYQVIFTEEKIERLRMNLKIIEELRQI